VFDVVSVADSGFCTCRCALCLFLHEFPLATNPSHHPLVHLKPLLQVVDYQITDLSGKGAVEMANSVDEF
jgi:hypothetical protein